MRSHGMDFPLLVWENPIGEVIRDGENASLLLDREACDE
jgi:hypothetical protein